MRTVTSLLDRLLNGHTMYRLMLHYLIVLVVAAFGLGFAGLVPFDPTAIAFSTALLLLVCLVGNRIFSEVFELPENTESPYITALILVLIVQPVTASDTAGVVALAFTALWAIASKFLFAVRQKHLFNPVAFAVVLSAVLLDRPAVWWVGGSPYLLPLVLVGGLLVVRKLRRVDLVATFLLVNVGTTALTTAPSDILPALSQTLLSSPVFFFAFVMLTEPLTAPTTPWPRRLFAAIVGLLSAPDFHIGSVYFTPEMALLVGNVVAFLIDPWGRLVLTLERVEQPAAKVFDFVFRSRDKLAFAAGQYFEWTLPVRDPDRRGSRRFFTVASSPSEDLVRLGVKFSPDASAFKRSLAAMQPGDRIWASQVAGSFTLPANRNEKLVFLAGGIGITPFRSMLQYLLDNRDPRPITVVYGVERPEEIAYRDVLDAAEHELGIETVYAVAHGAGRDHYPGYIDAALLRRVVPDYDDCIFYVSGPPDMVRAVCGTLRRMGVRRSRIKTDLFPGLS